MTPTLLAVAMHDGSRQFAELPETADFDQLTEHLITLHGSTETNFLSDNVVEVWFDFSYRGYTFTVNNQFGQYWFSVNDPECPDEILKEVTEHFSIMLDP